MLRLRPIALLAGLAGLLVLGAFSPRALAAHASAVAGQEHPSDVLVIGRVSNNPRKDYPALKGLADYLVAGLRDVGISEAAIQFAEDSDRMAGFLRDGTVDLVFDTVFPAIRYEAEAGAKLLLREWRDGAPDYRSILFKRRDVPLSSLGGLVGRKVAFERRGSTSAHFVPQAELEAAGLRTRELASFGETPPPGEVGYFFAGSENNVVVWVHRRLVEAGAFSDIDWDQPEDMPPDLKRDLEVFHTSAPLPRAVVIARGSLRAPVMEGVKRILLAAPSDPAGSAVLKSYRNVTRYDEFVGEAAAGLAAARRLATFGE